MKVKRLLMMLALVCLLAGALTVTTFARDPGASGQIGPDARYTLSSEGVLTISGTGSTYSYYPTGNSFSPFWGASIKSVIIEMGITNIGDNLFQNCPDLETVTIAPGVTAIGEYAFCDCPNLTQVKLPGTVSVIGPYAFSYCPKLTTINCPKSVTSIGKWAFAGCDSLVELPGVELDGAIRWTLNKDTGVMRFTGSGDMPNFDVVNNHYPTWNYLDDYIRSVIVDEGITSIGSFSFWDCQNLEAVTVPGTVRSIGQAAFMCCYQLADVQLSDGITTIYDEAFYNCTSLTNINIPETMQHTGRNVFYGCDDLKIVPGVAMDGAIRWTMNKDTGVLHITGSGDMPRYNVSGNSYPDWNYLRNDITTAIIDEGITSVGSFSFWDCQKLESVTIPSTVTTIGKAAFQCCCGLTDVQLPSGLTTIADQAFDGCGITAVSIPASVTTIGNNAFSDTGLTDVTVPDTVTYLGGYVFEGCTSLKAAVLSRSLTYVPAGTFMGCSSLTDVELGGEELYYIENRAFSDCTALAEIKLPDGIKYIQEEAFKNCTTLHSMTLPRWLEELESNAFEGCTGLETVVLSKNVRGIGEGCFRDCAALTNVEISGALTYMNNYAFSGCTALKSIAVRSMACNMGYQCLPVGITLYGYEGTAVQTYAQGNALEFISLGQPSIDCYPVKLMRKTYEYCGAEWCPSVSIEDLTEGEDYTVSYKNNINAGTATVVITGIGDIPGTAEVDFIITPIDMEGVVGGYLDKSAYEYTGQIIVPKLTVIFWGYDLVKLEEGVDYTLTSFGRDPGYGKLVVEGIGNFCGSVEAEFPIIQGQLSNNSFALEQRVYPCTGQPVEPKIIAPDHLVEGVDYTVSYADNTNPGTGQVILQGLGNWTGTVTLYFEIAEGLDAPQVTASNLSPSGKIKLTWARIYGAETYQIWRSAVADGTYILAGTAPGTGFVDLKAQPGIKYFYKVVAVGQEGSSIPSNIVSRVAKLTRPTVRVKLNADSRPLVSWNQVSGAMKYQVYRSTSQNGKYALLKTVPGTGWVDTTARPGVTYYYKVVAVGRSAEGNSNPSQCAILLKSLTLPLYR